MRRGGAAGGISTGVDDQIDVERGDRAIGFDPDLGFEYFGVARVLPKAISADGSKRTGRSRRARQQERCEVRRRRYLGAEAAADVGYAQTYFLWLEAEKVRELGGVAHR